MQPPESQFVVLLPGVQVGLELERVVVKRGGNGDDSVPSIHPITVELFFTPHKIRAEMWWGMLILSRSLFSL